MTLFANRFNIEMELITFYTLTYILIEEVFNGVSLIGLKVHGLTVLDCQNLLIK